MASRLLLLTVFALALAGKISGRKAWGAFVQSIHAMSVVAPSRAAAAAVATAVAEASIVVLAAVPVRWAGTAAFALAAGLLACLTLAVVRVIRRGAAVPCRCFGPSETPLGAQHVTRNLVLIAVALAGLAASFAGGPLDPPLAAVVAVFGAALGLLMSRWDDLVSLLRTT